MLVRAARDAVFDDTCGNLLNLHQDWGGAAVMPPTREPDDNRLALVPRGHWRTEPAAADRPPRD